MLVGAMQYIYYTMYSESSSKMQGAKGALLCIFWVIKHPLKLAR
jgi:hypothetical protein